LTILVKRQTMQGKFSAKLTHTEVNYHWSLQWNHLCERL